MAKPSSGRGGDSSDDEDANDPETISEMNRIMGRDKQPKQTSAPGLSLAERAQARMKAAQGTRKPMPQHASTSSISSLTQHVPHREPPKDHHHASSSTPTTSLAHHPQHAHHGSSPSISSNSTSSTSPKGHHVQPSISTQKDSSLSSEPQFSSPMMRTLSSKAGNNSSSNHAPPPPPPPDSDPPENSYSKPKTKVTPSDAKSTASPPSPSLAEHYRTLSVGPPPVGPSKPHVDDDVELEPPPELSDDEEEEKAKKKKKKKGFFGKLKKAVGKKGKDDSDSDSGEEDEKEAKEMQADIDRIMRGKVSKPSGPAPAATGAKPLSLQERAALAQKRAAGK